MDAPQLTRGIALIEAQRDLLGDDITELALGPLRERLAQLRGEAPQARTPVQRLKQVTVLFMDVVGSTALGSRLTPEDIHLVMDTALARFTRAIADHGGRVLQYTGDGLLAAFGTEQVAEDDAERAARAALAILRLAGDEAGRVQREHGQDGFAVRVGLHTGPVLLGGGVDGEGTIRGSTVNLAARMEQHAPPGQVRLSHDTAAQLQRRFVLQAQPPLQVKGRAQPMQTWLLLAEQAGGTAAAWDDPLPALPLRGRDAALQSVLDTAALARAQPGQARVLTVLAEAGLGSSRLVREGVQRLAGAGGEGPRWAVLAVTAVPAMRRQPYALLRQLLLAALAQDSGAPLAAPEARRDALVDHLCGRFAAADGEAVARSQAEVLAHVLGWDLSEQPAIQALLRHGRQMRDAAFALAARWLLGRAAEAPRLLWLDDLHHADAGSLEFIEHLAAQPSPGPLLLLAAARPQLLDQRPTWAQALPGAQRCVLAPLSPGDAHALADALLARLQPPSPALAALLVERAGGNPLFLQELVRAALDQGTLQAEGAHWRLASDGPPAASLPATLTSLLQARLDRLAGDERLQMQVAALVGPVFWDDAVRDATQALHEAGGPPPPAPRLPQLAQRGLVQPLPPSALPPAEQWRFEPPLLQEVASGTVLRGMRRTVHRRIADWLTQAAGAQLGDWHGAIAEHLARADEPAAAGDHCLRGAEHAAQRLAHDVVQHLTQRALTLLPEDDLDRRWRVHGLRWRLADVQADGPACAAELAAQAALLARRPDPAWAARLAARRAITAGQQGETGAAVQHARQARQLALACGATDTALTAATTECSALFRAGQLKEARAVGEAALAEARRLGDAVIESDLLTMLAGLASLQGDAPTALALLQHSLPLNRRTGNRYGECAALINLGDGLLRLGAAAEAAGHLRDAVQLARALGLRGLLPPALLNLSAAQEAEGDAEAALATAGQARQQACALGQADQAAYAQLAAGQAWLAQQRWHDAEAAFAQAEAELQAQGLGEAALEATVGRAHATRLAGDLPRALTLLAPALQHWQAGGSFDGADQPLRMRWVCVAALQAAGRDDEARPLLAQAWAELRQQAQALPEAAQRERLLQGIAHHRALRALAGG